MTRYGEYVTEQTVLMRHRPDWAPTIHKFFADAGNNIVQTFYSQDSHLHGYIFHVMTSAQDGISYGLVTGGKAVFEDGQRLLPTPADEAQIKRQFTHSEWFRFPFSGPPDAIPLALVPEEPDQSRLLLLTSPDLLKTKKPASDELTGVFWRSVGPD